MPYRSIIAITFNISHNHTRHGGVAIMHMHIIIAMPSDMTACTDDVNCIDVIIAYSGLMAQNYKLNSKPPNFITVFHQSPVFSLFCIIKN